MKLYFDTEPERTHCLKYLLEIQGFETQLDQYEAMEELGSGATACVMLVKHKMTNKQFAMKLFYNPEESSTDFIDFQREVTALYECKNIEEAI